MCYSLSISKLRYFLIRALTRLCLSSKLGGSWQSLQRRHSKSVKRVKSVKIQWNFYLAVLAAWQIERRGQGTWRVGNFQSGLSESVNARRRLDLKIHQMFEHRFIVNIYISTVIPLGEKNNTENWAALLFLRNKILPSLNWQQFSLFK